MFGMSGQVAGIEGYDANSVVCNLSESSPRSSLIFVEADGEILGTLPAKISIVPAALTLLFPKR